MKIIMKIGTNVMKLRVNFTLKAKKGNRIVLKLTHSIRKSVNLETNW